jgi:hypothetical protein
MFRSTRGVASISPSLRNGATGKNLHARWRTLAGHVDGAAPAPRATPSGLFLATTSNGKAFGLLRGVPPDHFEQPTKGTPASAPPRIYKHTDRSRPRCRVAASNSRPDPQILTASSAEGWVLASVTMVGLWYGPSPCQASSSDRLDGKAIKGGDLFTLRKQRDGCTPSRSANSGPMCSVGGEVADRW